MNPFKRLFSRKHDSVPNSMSADLELMNKVSPFLQQINARAITNSPITQIINNNSASTLIDEKIDQNVEIIRKSRFFIDAKTAQSSQILAEKISNGDLSGGSNIFKSRALAWCSRFLANFDNQIAEKYLKVAQTLESCVESSIAEAFIISSKGDKNAALKILSNLTSPLSATAALMIVENHDGAEQAVKWFDSAGFKIEDLDTDGKYYLCILYIQYEDWDSLLKGVKIINDDDMIVTPALSFLVALSHLITAVPNDLRSIVVNQVPFNAAKFPLSEDVSAIESRQKAHQYFELASKIAQQFGLINASKIFEEYTIWLELKSSQQHECGLENLKNKLRNPKASLHLIPLSLSFGLKLDVGLIESEVDKQIALCGGVTKDTAAALFSLTLTKQNPADIADYIDRHHEQLTKFFDLKSLYFFEIEILAQANMPDKARECLDLLIAEGLSETEENKLKTIIADIEGTNPIEIMIDQYKKTDATVDLIVLVEELERRARWSDLGEYGYILFNRTHTIQDAERLIKAYYESQNYEGVVTFLGSNSDFISLSRNLHLIFCWALFYEGELVKASTELAKYGNDYDNPNYRALLVNLKISIGDWNSLNAYVAIEWSDREKRNAHELIKTAQLAYYINSPIAKELTIYGADKGNNDSNLLASAYLLASNAGWEDNEKAAKWFATAISCSEEDGPFHKKTIQDFLDMKPDWDRRELETTQMLSRGQIPMFIAGESLNRTLIHMMLVQAYYNISEQDPRRRSSIAAYSGKRKQVQIKTNIAAIDITVLLTLSFLKIIDKALNAFETVYIPHSTLSWLFSEKQKISFHQPSRIRAAQHLQRLIAMGVVEKLVPSTIPDSDLSLQIGDELALLITEATKKNSSDKQHIVVKTFPVHRISSFMEETVDLSGFSNVLSSCEAILNKLHDKGLVTIEEEQKARAYFQLQEKPWPNQPNIADGAVLYLDDVSTSHFLQLGLLDKFRDCGFTSIVSPKELSEANELSLYGTKSEQINEAIEQIRSSVSSRISSGRILVGKKGCYDTKESVSDHPSVELFSLATKCGCIIIDDRFMNQHENISEAGIQIPIYSTLDILSKLVSDGSIHINSLYEYNTMLRRAGYFFIPITEEELLKHLSASSVKESRVVETSELKSIRENLLRIRMSNWVQLPNEAVWFDSIFKAFINVLRRMWEEQEDISELRVRSNWIIQQIDFRGWSHFLVDDSKLYDANIAQNIGANLIILLLLPLTECNENLKEEYKKWVDEAILEPIKENYLELYELVVDGYKSKIEKIVRTIVGG